MTIRRHVGCLCLAAMAAGTVQAGDFHFTGFGSFIAGMKDHNIPNTGTADPDDLKQYAGYETTDFSFDPDSLVGVQATVQANEKASVTVQLVSRGNEAWDTEIDWAYVRYQFTDEFAGRLGRIRVPFYLYSDFITVGYAYPWITPPFEVYNIPFSNVNGGDVVFQHTIGSVDMLLQAYVGSEKFTFGTNSALEGNEGETRNQMGIVSEFSWKAFKFRYAYHFADVYGSIEGTPIAGLVTTLEAFGLNDTADRFTLDRDVYDFHDLGVQYDDGSLLLVVEAIRLSAHEDAPAAETNGAYITAGYRFGDVMPVVTWSVRDDTVSDLAQDLAPTNPFYATIVGVQKGMPQDHEQYTIGVRWDFTDGMAFKGEVVNFKDKNNSDFDTVLTRAGIQVVF